MTYYDARQSRSLDPNGVKVSFIVDGTRSVAPSVRNAGPAEFVELATSTFELLSIDNLSKGVTATAG